MHGRAEEGSQPPQSSPQCPTPKPQEGLLRGEVPQRPLSLT